MKDTTHATAIRTVKVIDVIVTLLLITSVVWTGFFVTERVGRSLSRAATIETLSQTVPRASISRTRFERIQLHVQRKQTIPDNGWTTLPDPFSVR